MPPVCDARRVEQLAVLPGVEVLGDAVHALKRQHVAADRLIAAPRDDFGQIRARLVRRPLRLKAARRVGHRRHLDVRRDAARTDDVRLDARVGDGLVVVAADLGRQRDAAVVEQHLVRDRRDDVARRIR